MELTHECNDTEPLTEVQRAAKIVNDRLSYHFAGTNNRWNVPKNMPFMREFLNEVRTLCDLALSDISEVKNQALSPQLAEKINKHLHNLSQPDQHHELSMIFWPEQMRREMHMQTWIDEWHNCGFDIAAWFAKLPANMQRKVINYYYTQKL